MGGSLKSEECRWSPKLVECTLPYFASGMPTCLATPKALLTQTIFIRLPHLTTNEKRRFGLKASVNVSGKKKQVLLRVQK